MQMDLQISRWLRLENEIRSSIGRVDKIIRENSSRGNDEVSAMRF
jgi:hypothetical protein